jgi:hypothetical protein
VPAGGAPVSPHPGDRARFARAKTGDVTWGANVERSSPPRRERRPPRLGSRTAPSVVSSRAASVRGTDVHVLEDGGAKATRPRRLVLPARGGPTRAGRGISRRRLGTVPTRRCRTWRGSRHGGRALRPRRLRQLALGFYWSPLKIFEYMASGLPTVTIPASPLTEIVREGQEGLHAREGDRRRWPRPRCASRAIAPARGSAPAPRARWCERYSWASHCEQLERVLLRGSRRESPAGSRRSTPARGGARLVHAGAGLGPARSRARVSRDHHQPGTGGPRRPGRPPPDHRDGRRLAVAARICARPSPRRGGPCVHAQHSLSALGALGGPHARDGWP